MQKSFTVTQNMINAYSELNGDDEAIHLSQDYATSKGFRNTLLHGLYMMGMACDLATDLYGPSFLSNGELYVKWIAPACAGDDLNIAIEDDGQITADNQLGRTMIGHAVLQSDRTT